MIMPLYIIRVNVFIAMAVWTPVAYCWLAGRFSAYVLYFHSVFWSCNMTGYISACSQPTSYSIMFDRFWSSFCHVLFPLLLQPNTLSMILHLIFFTSTPFSPAPPYSTATLPLLYSNCCYPTIAPPLLCDSAPFYTLPCTSYVTPALLSCNSGPTLL